VTPQASPNRSTLTWLIPITLLVAVCALVGGLIARQLYATSKPVDVKQPPAAPSTPVATSDQNNGDNTVSVNYSEFAKSDPNFDPVRKAIQSYFNAINKRDFAKWRQVMIPAVAAQQTQADWTKGFNTTVDKDMFVYRIEATEKGADVFGSFTSTQDVADAPKDLKEPCIRWNMVWPMEKSGDGGVFRIGSPSVVSRKCDG
jgi:hypothetical protein